MRYCCSVFFRDEAALLEELRVRPELEELETDRDGARLVEALDELTLGREEAAAELEEILDVVREAGGALNDRVPDGAVRVTREDALLRLEFGAVRIERVAACEDELR